jgi:hypothetical protein
MKVALILTGYIDDAITSFPHYLEQINNSNVITEIGIFASIHANTGQSFSDIHEFREHFTGSKTFRESPSQKNLPLITSRGHPSIAEFAEAVNYWQDELKAYDVIWRGRWDSYLDGNSELLDTHLKFCCNLDKHCLEKDHQRHRVVSRSLRISYGRPIMEGKHHWATAHTVVAAFSDWENKWHSWVKHLRDLRFDAHSTWASIYTNIGASIENGKYSVKRVSPYHNGQYEEDTFKDYLSPRLMPVKYLPDSNPEHTRQDELRLRRESRRLLLEEKLKSQNPH